MMRWQGVAATLGPQRGGAYSVDLEDGIMMEGTFLEVTPFERLVFTFGWAGHPVASPGSTRVEVTFEPEANGTLVTLTTTYPPTSATCTRTGGTTTSRGWPSRPPEATQDRTQSRACRQKGEKHDTTDRAL